MSRAPPPTILVADDDPAVRDSLRALLEAAGFGVRAFASADQLLAVGNADQAACIVTDIDMPGATGLTVQQTLAARGVDVPVIVLSGSGEGNIATRALAAGAVAFLAKPIPDQALVACVRRALEERAKVRSR